MMNKIITSLFAVFSICCATLIQSEAAISDNHVAFFIFGDSLYDVGMTLYDGDADVGADSWPYGETYFKKPAGRFSDGRNIPDFIAEYANLPFLPPYLQPELSNYTNGVNFASASACVLVETRPKAINLKMQMDYFLEMVGKMKKQMGEADANKVLSKAVYMFNIGGNDYVSLPDSLSDSYKRQYMGIVLGNLTSHIRTIYNTGGRKFAFQNVGPIGCLPSTKEYYTEFVENCVKERQLMAKMHNKGFQHVVKALQSQLSGFKYTVFNYYGKCMDRIRHNSKYGFTESKRACCGTGKYRGHYTCAKNGTNFKVCSNPTHYLWFDGGHHTEKAYQQFARMYWSGSSNVVSPYNLKTLVDMH